MSVNRDRRPPLDLVASVIALLGLQVASLLMPPGALQGWITTLGYNVLFGVGKSLVALWVLFRIWQLMRDDGPARVMLIAITANVIGLAYSQAWNLLPSAVSIWTDDVALVVRVLALASLGSSLLQWRRLDRWVGWTALVYAVSVSLSIISDRLRMPGIPQPVISWAWAAVLAILLAGLLKMEGAASRKGLAAGL